jgi:ABC-type amino acid transport substrate-binding protein
VTPRTAGRQAAAGNKGNKDPARAPHVTLFGMNTSLRIAPGALLVLVAMTGVAPAAAQTAAQTTAQTTAQVATQTAAAPAASAPALPPTIERLRSSTTIRLGHREAAVPFAFLVDGKPQGYSVDLCLRVVEGLRRSLGLPALKVEWVPIQAAQRLPYTIEGRIDIECGNTTATAERRKTVAFTTPTFIAGAGVLVRAETGAKVLNDLKGKRIAVVASTTGERIVKRANEALLAIQPLVVKDNAEAFAALEAGRADAWITDDVLLAAYRAQAAEPKKYLLLDKRHTIEPLALMVRKDDAAFERAVDRELNALINAGDAAKLYQRWFMQPIPPKNVTLEVPASRLLREIFRLPTKMQYDADVIVL